MKICCLLEIRLIADTLTNPQSPLWQQYAAVIRDDLQQVQYQLEADNYDFQKVHHSLQSLLKHWEVIKPASLMSKPLSDVQEVNASLLYTSRLVESTEKNGIHPSMAKAAFQSMDDAMSKLFDQGDGASQAIVPIQIGHKSPPNWMYGIVLFITAILAIAGWRNYRNGQHNILIYPNNTKKLSEHFGVSRK